MKEKLLELQKKEQERVRQETMAAMEAGMEVIKISGVETSGVGGLKPK